MISPHPDNEPVDERLRAALRHAPDAHIQPPAALSDAILKQARKAIPQTPSTSQEQPVRPTSAANHLPASPARWLTGLMAAWQSLSRPSMAAGLASVMLAGVVGLMWRGGPPDDEMPRERRAEIHEAAPASEALPLPAAAAPEPAVTNRDAAEPPTASRAQRAEHAEAEHRLKATGTTTVQSIQQDRHQPENQPAKTPEGHHTPPPSHAPASLSLSKAVPTSSPQPPLPESVGNAARSAAAPPPAPVPAATVAVATPPPQVNEKSADRKWLSENTAAPAMRGIVMPSGQTGVAADQASAKLASAPASLVSLRQAIQRQPERWTWQRATGEAQPVTPSLLHWLQNAAQATDKRWQKMPASSASDSNEMPSFEIQLRFDGQITHTLKLQPHGLRWLNWAQTGEVTDWHAPLEKEPAQALRQSWPR